MSVVATASRQRTNEEWLADLRSDGEPLTDALADLRLWLRSGLQGYLLSRPDLGERSVEDLAAMADDYAQEALLQVRRQIDSFRGESRFTTWAAKLAVNRAISDLRRKRWSDWSLEGLLERTATPAFKSSTYDPETEAIREEISRIIDEIVYSELTEKQRTILLAIQVDGVAPEVLAELMGTNRNALYKAMHDARRRLKARLQLRGLSVQDVLAAYS